MKVYILYVLLFCSLYYAQKIDVKSPQSYQMERYGNIPINLNVGSTDVEIPLFKTQIIGSDKNLSLNLSYNSSGFIPTKRSNYVGLGWLLNFGGMITRDVQHLPDDEPQFAVEGNRQVDGLLVGIRNQNIAKESLFNNNTDVDDFGNFKSGSSTSFELAPDKFSFNFMETSGYFYIDAEKKPIIVSNDPNLKINIIGLENQPSPKTGCHHFNNSEIIITDGKGNKYYFGGSEENIEINYPLGTSRDSPNSNNNLGQNYYINAWYLRKVEFATGSNIVISYLKFEDVGSIGISDGFCQYNFFPPTYRLPGSEAFFEQHSYVNQTSTIGVTVTNDGIFSSVNSSSSNPALSYHFNLVKKVYPAKITMNGRKIAEFSYKQNEGSSFNNPSLGNVFNKYYKSFTLEKIFIYNGVNDLLVKNINFSYYRNNEYFFLDELLLNNLKYKFDYYDKSANLAHETTTSVDHWGYWNNKAEFSNPLIPDYKINPNTGEYVITGNSREPSTTSVQRTLLSKITYPTGGYSQFIYEPHDYSKKLNRTPNSNFLVETVSENGIVGGARIASVLESDGSQTVQTEYKYKSNYPTGSSSSGISSKVIRYSNFVQSGSNTQYNMLQRSFSNNFVPNSMSSSPINYSEVSVLKNGILQKKYLFSDYITNPDTLVYRKRQPASNSYQLLPQNVSNLQVKYMDRGSLRGKILNELDYNDSGSIIVKREHKYLNNKQLAANKYNIFFVGTGENEVLYYKDYFFPSNLIRTVTTNFFSNQSVNSISQYFYDHNYDNNIARESISTTTGGAIENSYQYAYEKGNQYLKDLNILGIRLRTTTKKIEDGSAKIISDVQLNYPESQSEAYAFSSGHPALKNIQSFDLQNLALSKNESTYDLYGDYGTLLQYTDKNFKKTVILWGYNNTLPVAKIEGIGYNDLMAIAFGWGNDPDTHNTPDFISLSNLDKDTTSESALLNSLDNFRSNPDLKNYQITTYTYDPLIGVTSITPPSGIREYYKYDSANRLEKIIDSSNKILKELKYNYKN